MSFATDFAAALNEKFPKENPWDRTFGVVEGKVYDKITYVNQDGRDESVHAFVEKSTGKLAKAAGWKAPAKRVTGELQSKFNLSTPEGFAEAVAAADRFTGYLYA